MKVVLDANVIVSALFGGVPRDAVLRALRDDDCFASDAILSELTGLGDKLRKKLPPSAAKQWFDTWLPAVLSRLNRIDVHSRIQLCRDPADNHYLSLAKDAEAEYLVTGDDDLLSLKTGDLEKAELESLAIVTPREFLALKK